jgi:hypothetical protein
LKDDNQTYNLWRFGDLKVLIRCKIHGLIPSHSATKGFRYVGVKAKLEYFPDIGWEEVTVGETAKWWIYTFIRPDAHLILARVNVHNSRIMFVEHKDMPAILPPGCIFKPALSSKILFVILQKLTSGQFGPGQYLLSHKPNDRHIAILKAVDSTKPSHSPGQQQQHLFYDLHTSHASSGTTDTQTFPFIPPVWGPLPNQIPYTFRINPDLRPDREIKQKIQKLAKNIKYCRAFADRGVCNKEDCPFPHLTLWKVFEIVQETKKRSRKKKKENRRKREQEVRGGGVVGGLGGVGAGGQIKQLLLQQQHGEGEVGKMKKPRVDEGTTIAETEQLQLQQPQPLQQQQPRQQVRLDWDEPVSQHSETSHEEPDFAQALSAYKQVATSTQTSASSSSPTMNANLEGKVVGVTTTTTSSSTAPDVEEHEEAEEMEEEDNTQNQMLDDILYIASQL